jgi:hypothetical protein
MSSLAAELTAFVACASHACPLSSQFPTTNNFEQMDIRICLDSYSSINLLLVTNATFVPYITFAHHHKSRIRFSREQQSIVVQNEKPDCLARNLHYFQLRSAIDGLKLDFVVSPRI